MDKTRQERYNMIYGNTARKIEDLAANKLSVKCKFVKRETEIGGDNDEDK